MCFTRLFCGFQESGKGWLTFVFTGITVLLSLTVFMLLVAEIMPATSDSVPLIGKSVFKDFKKVMHHIFQLLKFPIITEDNRYTTSNVSFTRRWFEIKFCLQIQGLLFCMQYYWC